MADFRNLVTYAEAANERTQRLVEQSEINRVEDLLAERDDEIARLTAELTKHEQRHLEAQKCINQIDDYLEYRWRCRDAKTVRDQVMNYIRMYSDAVSGGNRITATPESGGD